MVIEVLLCRQCRSHNVIKHGRDKRGVQRFLCHDCHATFQKLEDDRSYTEDFKSQVLASYHERASMRGVSRIFGISRETLNGWLKKAKNLPPLTAPLRPATEGDVLELDELWSFVHQRKNKKWVWMALCRRTRQIVAFAVGDRSEVTCRRLWQRIPLAYRRGLCFTDFWDAYGKVIPEDQHCRRSALSRWQREWTNQSHGALEQHSAPATSAVRASNTQFQQKCSDAQSLLTVVCA